MKRSLKTTCLIAVIAVTAAACSSNSRLAEASKPLVATTVSPITNLAANVVCGQADVIGLVPEGVNSHTFAPAPSDAITLADADVVVVNGLNLELPTIELAQANSGDDVQIVSLAEQTMTPDEYIFDFSFPKDLGDPNPHLWTNPLYALRYAELIKDTMIALDPDGAAGYDANFAAVKSRIETLDSAVREATATIPRDQRRLLTYHDSFPYFAREYDWTVIGAIQPSDFAQPTARDIADLIDQIEEEEVPAIFGSEVFSSPVLEQIAAETGARYVDELRDDDLPGEPGDPEHSYFGLMVFDFTTMVEALGGDASALGSVPTENLCDLATYG
ncbi:MAG: metal ABC transporter substrate-binding protein [Actinomycetia bacterium]|nr:metal ABC transporter substrate-binding protein [Actinomycetes bacterium]